MCQDHCKTCLIPAKPVMKRTTLTRHITKNKLFVTSPNYSSDCSSGPFSRFRILYKNIDDDHSSKKSKMNESHHAWKNRWSVKHRQSYRDYVVRVYYREINIPTYLIPSLKIKTLLPEDYPPLVFFL